MIFRSPGLLSKTMKPSSPLKKINIPLVLIVVIASFALAVLCYLLIIQTPLTRKRELLAAFLVFLGMIPLIYLFLEKYVVNQFQEFSRRAKIILLITSTVIGLFVSLTAYRPPVYVFLPRHTLTIMVPELTGSETPERYVALTWFNNGSEDVSLIQVQEFGNWQREEKRLFLEGSQGGSLRWEGRIDTIAKLEFESSPDAGVIELVWDGTARKLDLSGAGGTIPVTLSQDKLWERGWPLAPIPYFLAAFFLFFVLTIFFLTIQVPQQAAKPRKRLSWLLYALPMILFWGFFLFAIQPGYVPEDPMVQWQQVLSGNFTDQHPILFALFMGLVSRIYPFPASVAVSQILMVSFALAWGLAMLEDMGVSRIVLWGLAGLFALLPVNSLSVVTLLKDVPYSTAFLVLSIMILKTIRSQGEWLYGRWHWIGLGASLGSIALLRINGLPVALGSILIILIFFHHAWKRVVAAAGVLLLLVAAIYGPVYSMLKVEHVPEFGASLFLNHIAAHLKGGTSLTLDQGSYLNQLAPIPSWGYNCCGDNSTKYSLFPNARNVQNFDHPLLRQDLNKPVWIALDLFSRNPGVDIRHMVCASQIVWSINSSCPDRENIGIYTLLIEKNISKAEGISGSLMRLSRYYFPVITARFNHNLNLMMALYLYSAIYCASILSIRTRKWKLMLFLTPVAIQSAVLMLINVSQTYRYQYGVALVGMLALGFLLVPLISEKKQQNTAGNAEND